MVGGLAAAFVCAVLLAGVRSTGQSTPEPRRLTVLYTSQAFGQVRSCNCTKLRYGGYGRQAAYVDQVRKETPDVLIVEGGDLVSGTCTPQEKLKSEVAMKSLQMIGYAAFVPGESDIRYLQECSADAESFVKIPAALANVVVPGTEEHLFKKPYVTTTLQGGLRAAVIGLLGPEMLDSGMALKTRAEVKDPAESLASALPEARASADIVIVIAHMEVERARSLASAAGVDLIICTHSKAHTILPEKDEITVGAPAEKIGECLFIESGTRFGWSVGRLDLEIEDGNISRLKHRLIYLDRSFEEPAEMVKLYDDYNEKVRELSLSQGKKLREEMERLYRERGIDPAKFRPKKLYAGAEQCKDCHEEDYEKWKASRHASAIKTLEKTNQHYDPECVRCHTTGAYQRGGFINLKETPDLADVQCESCHGPGYAHTQKPAKGYGKLQEEVCRSCHTEDLDPDFNYEEAWARIEH